MTWAPGPVVTRRRLGGELKQLRERSGFKLEDVARRLECSPSKISRLENGKGIPRTRDVRDMLEVYGVADSAERERLLEWSRTGQARMWWQNYADVLDQDTASYVDLEWDAATIRAYESHLVHGLLQTREYARAVLRAAWRGQRDDGQIDRLVDMRLQRQEVLTSDHGLTFTCVLDESTLWRVVGSPRVQEGQLRHLVALAKAEHVDVRVLPFSAPLVAVNLASFAVFDFAQDVGQRLVFREGVSTSEFVNAPDEVASYAERMRLLVDAALSEAESVPLLERAAQRVATS